LEDIVLSYSKSWWDSKSDEISFGINRIGRFEHLFRKLAKEIYFCDPVLNPELHPAGTTLPSSSFSCCALLTFIDCVPANEAWKRKFHKIFAEDKLIELFGENAVRNLFGAQRLIFGP
jgi:hypothetical protein